MFFQLIFATNERPYSLAFEQKKNLKQRLFRNSLEDKNSKKREKQTEKRRRERNCLRKRFYSFKYVLDHANVRFFFYVNSLHCFCILAQSFQLRSLPTSHKFTAIHIFYLSIRIVYVIRIRHCFYVFRGLHSSVF